MGIQLRENDVVVTGAAGFIGSCLAKELLVKAVRPEELILVDDLEAYESRPCTAKLRELKLRVMNSAEFLQQCKNKVKARAIFHMGASSSTEETREDFLKRVNVDYSKTLWEFCKDTGCAFLYASSAATYGDGSQGFDDDPAKIPSLKPLNPYGRSKQLFDLFVLDEIKKGQSPQKWAGFKFFNVYGHGEEHKGGQASVLWGARKQLKERGLIKLFKSHNPDFEDGKQQRDFVWIGDITRTLLSFYENKYSNGIYNLGTGRASTFLELATAIAKAEGKELKTEFIPTPEHLREHYQYFTEAKLERLRASGYDYTPTPLEAGVSKSIEAIDTQQ